MRLHQLEIIGIEVNEHGTNLDELTRKLAIKYIPHKFILGDGGLYLFIKLDGIKAREILEKCYKRGVIFTLGDIFYTDESGEDTLRIGFSRTSLEDIKKGIRIIGEEARMKSIKHPGGGVNILSSRFAALCSKSTVVTNLSTDIFFYNCSKYINCFHNYSPMVYKL